MAHIRKLDKEQMRRNNVRMIFESIYRNNGLTKTQLAEKTGMSAMTVGRITDFLLERGMVIETDNDGVFLQGRPAKQLHVNSADIANIGVSLDVGGVFVGLVDPYGKILKSDRRLFSGKYQPPEETLRMVADIIRELINTHCVPNGPWGRIQTVGLTIPGIVDSEQGYLKLSTQMRWKSLPIVEILQSFPGMPQVLLENDLKARAQAENRCGAGKGYGNNVLLSIGSGVGAGIIIDNKIYRGKDNMAGEIGHIVLNSSNRLCECGRFGCLQSTITEAALLREACIIQPGIDMDGLIDVCQQGLPWAGKLIDICVDHIMMTIDLLANVYSPDAIILCGSLIDRSQFIRDLIMASYKKQNPVLLNANFDLRFSDFGPNGNTIAAATIAFNHNLDAIISSPVS